MPFRLDPEKYGEWRTKIQFTTASWMPYQIYQACLATGTLSNTAYCQIAICEKLARDLDIDLDELLANLPARRTNAARLWDPTSTEGVPGKIPETSTRRRLVVGRYGMGGSGDEEVR